MNDILYTMKKMFRRIVPETIRNFCVIIFYWPVKRYSISLAIRSSLKIQGHGGRRAEVREKNEEKDRIINHNLNFKFLGIE